MKILVVVDMQNDFIDGVLGGLQAQTIVRPLSQYIKTFDGKIIATLDTHSDKEYLSSQEGKHLPVKHTLQNTPGWELNECIYKALTERESNPKTVRSALELAEALQTSMVAFVEKNQFASPILAQGLLDYAQHTKVEVIEFCGVCTDICVVSNALAVKMLLPEQPLFVHEDLCAGTSVKKHNEALSVLSSCQVAVV